MKAETNTLSEIRRVYTEEAESYDKDRIGFKTGQYFFRVERSKILRYLKPPKILELGVGTGRYSIFFAKLGFDCTGIDITPAMLDKARKKANEENLNLKLFSMDAHNLGFQDEVFDSVFCDRTFKFFHDPDRVLREAHRVLKPKGRIIIDVEAPHFAMKLPAISILNAVNGYISRGDPREWRWDKNLTSNFYSERDLTGMFKAAGFNVLETERIFNFPFFLVRLAPSWLLEKLFLYDVSVQRGLIGSKVMVVGCKGE